MGLPAPDLESAAGFGPESRALLKVLAHADRLVLLQAGTRRVLCQRVERDLHTPTDLVSAVGVLRQEGLVDTREGKHIYYRLVSEDAAAVMQVLHSRICGAAMNGPAQAD